MKNLSGTESSGLECKLIFLTFKERINVREQVILAILPNSASLKKKNLKISCRFIEGVRLFAPCE